MEKEMEILNGEDVFSENESAEEPSGGHAPEESEDTKGKISGIYEILEDEIMQSLNLSEAEKTKRFKKLLNVRKKKVNLLFAGSTGSGKSSTINALFNMDVAKVGVGVDPETDTIRNFTLDNLIIWDTPGLGDGVERDREIVKEIIRKLNEVEEGEDAASMEECLKKMTGADTVKSSMFDSMLAGLEKISSGGAIGKGKGRPLIDMVIVVMDSSSKDLGTSYDLINNVLIPCLGDEAEKRILIALNQADIAMKGKHWDEEKNEPDAVLQEFLKKKAASVRERIYESTGLTLEPVCYCAGYKEEGGEQRKPYNLTKLLYHIIQAIPKEKRLAFADNINEDEENWQYDDEERDYQEGLKRSFGEAVVDGFADGLDTGADLGEEILGLPGLIIGGIVGAAVGGIKGVFDGIFG